MLAGACRGTHSGPPSAVPARCGYASGKFPLQIQQDKGSIGPVELIALTLAQADRRGPTLTKNELPEPDTRQVHGMVRQAT